MQCIQGPQVLSLELEQGWKGSRPGLAEGNVSQGQWGPWRNLGQRVMRPECLAACAGRSRVVLALGQAEEVAQGLGHQLLTALSSQRSTRAIN